MRTQTACLVFVLLFAGTILTGCPPHNTEGTVYFLVADPNHPESGSYILPLTDSDAIAHADAVIADPDGTDSHLVVAHIASGGSDDVYINRNLGGDGAAWSWRVTEFVNFADFTIEILDGNARYVEDHFDKWCNITNSTIGFWSYRVIRRVETSEMNERRE